MAFGFQFFRPSGQILIDINWPTMGYAGKYTGDDPLSFSDPAAGMRNNTRIEAYIANGETNGEIFVFEPVSGKPANASRGFQFFRPDGSLIASSEYPPMKVVDFRRVTQDNSASVGVLVPAGKRYAIVHISTTTSGYPYDIQKHGAQPPTYEEWWSYRWRNAAIRPRWEGDWIYFSIREWSSPDIYESDTGTINPVDQYLKYDCMVIDVTGI